MKFIFSILFTLLLSSCASVEKLSSSDHCEVWEDRLLFGTVNVSVANGIASWSGNCKKLWWECKSVKAHLDNKTREVYLSVSDDQKLNWDPQKPMGKINNNVFTYSDKNPLEKYIKITPMTVDMSAYLVSYNVQIPSIKQDTKVKYAFNNKCSAEEALIGALAVGAVSKLKSENTVKSH